MGHKNKTEARTAIVQEAKRLATTALKGIGELGREKEREKQKLDLDLAAMEDRIHKQLNNLAEVVAELREDFELERRPWWKKLDAYLFPPSAEELEEQSQEDEFIDIDFDEDIGQEDAGRAESEPGPSDAISKDEPFSTLQDQRDIITNENKKPV